MNQKFLFGFEKVFFGDIQYGQHPESTVYHYWFGEFSLGYGGWLSPTIVNNRRAFRLGLAKLGHEANQAGIIDDFVKILEEKRMINIEPVSQKRREISSYGGFIPIGGPLKNIYNGQTLLIGDAGGFCGPFAADGIKGAVVSAKVGAELITDFLKNGDSRVFKLLKSKINKYDKLMTYYKKQALYRFAWNQIKHNDTFVAMIELIGSQKDTFISQFSDAKDSGGDLTRLLLQPKLFPKLLKFGLLWLRDVIVGVRSRIYRAILSS